MILIIWDVYMLKNESSVNYSYVVVTLLSAGFALCGLNDFLVFHGIVEIFSIVVACSIFIIVWNVRRFQEDGYLIFIGIFFFFTSILGLFHFLSYKGMTIFAGSDWNMSTQAWIAGRLLQSISFAVSPFLMDRKIRVSRTMAIYAATVLLILASIFWWKIFPECYVPGSGATPFKTVFEVIIILVFLASIPLLFLRRRKLHRDVLRYIVSSICFLALSELVFALYPEASGFAAVVGHLFTLTGYFCMYKAVVEIGLSSPFALLFRSIKQGELELQKEHDFVSAVLDTAGALVVVLDHGGRIIRFNKACESASGYIAPEVQGMKMTELFLGPEEGVLFSNFISLPPEQYTLKSLETWLITKTGNKKLITWTHTLLTGDEPGEAHVILTGIDITQRRIAEEELKLSAERYRSLYNNTPVMLHSLDKDFRIISVSKYWLENMGYERMDVIGRHFGEFLALSSRRYVETTVFGEYLKAGSCMEAACEVVRKDGTKMDVLLSVMGERDGAGEINRSLAVMVDVTDRKRAQKEIEELNRNIAMRADEIEEANRQLEKLNNSLEEMLREEVAKSRQKDFLMIQQSRQAAMGEMIGNIAHQWRQPLNAIGLYIQDLQDSFEHGELTEEYLNSSVGQAMDIVSHMSQTINDFRNFFKPDKEVLNFSVKDVIQRVLNFVSHSFKDSGVRLDVEMRDDIFINGLPNEYSQVILNILNNAREALVERKVAAPMVKIQLSWAGDKSIVTISDNAGGIPVEIMDRIFDPYFTTKGAGGTGIGLYISKTIIEQNMNGILTVRNCGEGAEFRIEV
jgi:PAS domain S-box-containing protein